MYHKKPAKRMKSHAKHAAKSLAKGHHAHHKHPLPHTKHSIQHHQPEPYSMMKSIPIYPLVVGFIGLLFLVLAIFSSMPAPIGKVVQDSIDDSPYCLKEGRDGMNYKVTDKSECCFLIENTDRCIGPLKGTSAKYINSYTGKVEGEFSHSYACYGSSTRKVLFAALVKNYCNLEI